MKERIDCLIIYRTIPHYRERLYEELSKRISLTVASSSNVPSESRLKVRGGDFDWLRLFEARWVVKKEKGAGWFRFCFLPTKEIMRSAPAAVVVIEGTYKVSSTYRVFFNRLFCGGPRVVVWSQGLQMGRGFSGIKNRIAQYSRLPLFALADANLVYSHEGAGFIGRILPGKRTYVARNTLYVDSKTIEDSVRHSRPPGGLRVLFVGRLTQDKRVPELAKLILGLVHRGIDVELTVIGEGPDYEKLSVLQRENEGVLKVLGAVYREDELAHYFSTSDVCASLGSLGLMVNHSLAYGCPVLALARNYRTGPHHHPEFEYVIDGVTGVIAHGNNTHEFSEILSSWAGERESRWEERERIRRYYKENISIEAYADDFARAVTDVKRGDL